MPTDAILEFLRDQNRPFSANDILQNVGKEHGKAAVQKSLDRLVQNKQIIDKAYGKQKVYCIVQDDAVNSNEMGDELRQMDQEINELTTNLKSAEEQLQSNLSELKSLQNTVSTEQAQSERDALNQEVLALKTKVNNLKENSKPIPEEEKLKISKGFEKYTKEYKKRKRICMDIINSILEGYPKTKKHLFEDIGIETDEDVGFKME